MLFQLYEQNTLENIVFFLQFFLSEVYFDYLFSAALYKVLLELCKVRW
jgi:hypothetical protein